MERQNSVAQTIREYESTSFGVFTLFAIGFAVSGIMLYRRVPDLVAKVAVCGILLVLLDGWWNTLEIVAVERMLVLMPTMTSVTVLGALVHRALVQNQKNAFRACSV